MPNSFIRVPGALGPTAFVVLAALCKRADADGRCWPSISKLCDDTGLSPACVREKLGDLAVNGVITVTRSRTEARLNRPNEYKLASEFTPGATVPRHRTTPRHSTATAATVPCHGVVESPATAYPNSTIELNHRTQRVSQSKKLRFSDDDFALAEEILRGVRQVVPTLRAPRLDSWAHQVRLMRDRDQRTTEQILKVFRWANSDNFWRANILSPEKLRKQFDVLTAQMARPTAGRSQAPQPVSHPQSKAFGPSDLLEDPDYMPRGVVA